MRYHLAKERGCSRRICLASKHKLDSTLSNVFNYCVWARKHNSFCQLPTLHWSTINHQFTLAEQELSLLLHNLNNFLNVHYSNFNCKPVRYRPKYMNIEILENIILRTISVSFISLTYISNTCLYSALVDKWHFYLYGFKLFLRALRRSHWPRLWH